MKLILFIVAILANKASTAANFDSAYLAFIGSSYNDYKLLRNGLNFSKVISVNYFNASRPSVFILHGWRDGFREAIGKELVEAYLHRNDCNIIVGDWSFYSWNHNYVALAESVPRLALTFLNYLYKIKETGYDLTRIHFVGHSLGAHVLGGIGEMLKADNIFIPRITGLDPAGPTFNAKNVFEIFAILLKIPSNSGLQRGNARFVDVIHTDAGLTGTTASIGDLDFWPNGGSKQPSCKRCPSANGDKGMDCVGCNHRTSWLYFAESVRSSMPLFMSLRCPDGVTGYTEKKCKGPEIASMGYHGDVTSKRGNYYLRTNAAAPFSRS